MKATNSKQNIPRRGRTVTTADFEEGNTETVGNWVPAPSYGLIGATKTVLRKYAVFTGRASRSEYWYFFLAETLALGALLGASVMSFLAAFTLRTSMAWGFMSMPLMLVALVLFVALIVPSLSVLARRLQDMDKPGYLVWFTLLPFVGSVLHLGLLILAALPGTQGPNQYDTEENRAVQTHVAQETQTPEL